MLPCGPAPKQQHHHHHHHHHQQQQQYILLVLVAAIIVLSDHTSEALLAPPWIIYGEKYCSFYASTDLIGV
jgi:hypothetical protein